MSPLTLVSVIQDKQVLLLLTAILNFQTTPPSVHNLARFSKRNLRLAVKTRYRKNN